MVTSLGTEFERFIDEQVKMGNYPTRQAVIEAALRTLQEAESKDAVSPSKQDLAAIEVSRQQIARGEDIDFDEFAAQTRKKYGIT